jgi:hypothetical protein
VSAFYRKLSGSACTITGFAQRTVLSAFLKKVEPAQSRRGWAFDVAGAHEDRVRRLIEALHDRWGARHDAAPLRRSETSRPKLIVPGVVRRGAFLNLALRASTE